MLAFSPGRTRFALTCLAVWALPLCLRLPPAMCASLHGHWLLKQLVIIFGNVSEYGPKFSTRAGPTP